jgi:hypothetical protein
MGQTMTENPRLKALGVLIGEWITVGTHPMVPGVTFHGRTSFDWFEAGAFVIMHSSIDEPDIPNGVAIFGSDDATDEGSMLYFDVRGVSREYKWTMVDNVWKWWRTAPGFSQRMVATILDDGRTMVSRGDFSRDSSTWESDLELTYTRAS